MFNIEIYNNTKYIQGTMFDIKIYNCTKYMQGTWYIKIIQNKWNDSWLDIKNSNKSEYYFITPA